MASSSNIWWQILAGNPHDCSWSHFPDYPSSSEPCIPCQPCSCPPCPTESFWVRPAEWPALPAFSSSSSEAEEKIVGLVAVEDTDLETLAILCEGAYTVDWGDGSAPENVASGVKAQHRYTYADITTNPLSYGYKTVIVTVTPQAGQNITSIDFDERHTDAGTRAPIAKWLDLDLNIPNCTYMMLGGGSQVRLYWLEQVHIREHALTSAYEMFQYCYALMSVPLFDTSQIEDMSYMFYLCGLLKSIPPFDTSSVTDVSLMLESCYSLVCVPEMDTAKVTNMYYMLDYCYSLQCVPLFDTHLVTDMSGMFNYNHSMSCVPPFDTSEVIEVDFMFQYCTSVTEVPLLNFIKVENLAQTFWACSALPYLPNFNTPSVTRIEDLFAFCESLTILPPINCSSISFVGYTNTFARRCDVLSKSRMYGVRYGNTNPGYDNKPLSASALNEIFTNLGTAAGTQYVVITNCYGASDPLCDRTIATAKGWTVIG